VARSTAGTKCRCHVHPRFFGETRESFLARNRPAGGTPSRFEETAFGCRNTDSRMARISVNAAGDLGMVPINYVAIDVGEKLNSLDGKVLELEEEVDDQFEFDRHTENRFSQGEERIAALEADKHRLEGLVMELMAFARSLQAAPTD
jgi:hypothetical protein